MKTTKVKCPKCGAEFAIPEHEHVTIGIAIGKDSGLGTVYPALADEDKGEARKTPGNAKPTKKSKATQRLEELKRKGVNTDNFFSIVNADGVGIAMKWEDGMPVAVTDKDLDELEKEVFENGYVRNTRLYRRFVLAQLMRMMNSHAGFTKSLHNFGYKYQWKMAIEEIRVLSILESKDKECFDERRRWFDFYTVRSMVIHYIDQLKRHIESRKIRHCNGKPYIKIDHRNVFVNQVNDKILNPAYKLLNFIDTTPVEDGYYAELYHAIKNFVPCGSLKQNTPQCQKFVDAYKGEGAFYALKNLILFHDCKIYLESGVVIKDKYEAMAYVNKLADEYKGEGWRLFGFMKKVVADNRFDFKARMRKLGIKGY